MKHFSISDNTENLISSNLTVKCLDCFNKCNSKGISIPVCPEYGDSRKQGKIVNSKSSTFLCCDVTKTTKLFKTKLEGLSYAYYDLAVPKKLIEDEIKKSEQQKVNRLVHNLTSINAHNIQEIYDLIPQEVLSSNWRTQIEFIEKEISKNTKKTAMMFLRIAKHNIHMKSEFSIYRKLDREDTATLEIKNWSIKNVLLNVLHTFFADFTNNRIYIQVNDYHGKIKFDYETIQVAFYHLIENASKYAMPNSTINIEFVEEENFLVLKVKMRSLYIKPLEREKIFLEGVSGSLAKSIGKSGDGIGMWRINQMMILNSGTFNIICGEVSEKIKGIEFSDNEFNLSFKK